MVSRDIVEYAFKEMKRWYVEQEKLWNLFVEERAKYIAKYKIKDPLVGAIDFTKNGPGGLYFDDFDQARTMVRMHASVLSATLAYERSFLEQNRGQQWSTRIFTDDDMITERNR